MNNAEVKFSSLPWEVLGSRNCISCNVINVAKEQDVFFVTLWNKHKATVLRVDVSAIDQINVSSLKSSSYCLQELTFESLLYQVLEIPGKLLFLSSCGVLKAVTFDDLRRFQKNVKINLTLVHSFPPPKKVLRALALNGNLLLVAAVLNYHVTIDVYEMDPSTNSTEVFSLFSLLLEIQQEQDGEPSCVLCACDKEMSSIFTGLQDNECYVVLIGLNTGSVFWVPFAADAGVQTEVKKLYHAGRSVREIISAQGSCCLFILLDGGVIVMVTRTKTEVGNLDRRANDFGTLRFDTFALPGYIRTLSVISKIIVCSDGIQCWRVKRDQETETICLPPKGVTALASLPGSSICLAFTKHNVFYCVDVDSNFSSKDNADKALQAYCDLESPYQYIRELKDQTGSLVNIETSLAIEDDVLEAVSLATRSDILGAKFSGRVLVYNVDKPSDYDETDGHLPTDITYKLTIEVKNNSSFNFSAQLWNMCLSVITPLRGVVSKTVHLRNSLMQSSTFSAHVFIPLATSDLASKLKLSVNLVTELPEPDRGQWISIPVITEELCISHFLSVLSDTEKGLFRARTASVDDQINSLLNDSTSSLTNTNSYTIHLPAHLRNVSDIMIRLLSKRRHRCEDYLKLLKGGTIQNEVHLLFGDSVVTLSFNQTVSTLTVMSTETQILHSVKMWIIRTLSETNKEKCVPPPVVSKARCLLSVLESVQLKPDLHVKNLEAVHNEIRTNISAKLAL